MEFGHLPLIGGVLVIAAIAFLIGAAASGSSPTTTTTTIAATTITQTTSTTVTVAGSGPLALSCQQIWNTIFYLQGAGSSWDSVIQSYMNAFATKGCSSDSVGD